MRTTPEVRDELIGLLRHSPSHPRIASIVDELQNQQPADLNQQGDQLEGAWELCWSSANQPWLKQSPWLQNLQVLDPYHRRAFNLLRLRGPLQHVGAIRVDASLNVVDQNRVQIQFRRGGWMGPRLSDRKRLDLMRDVDQRFPAWLDITVLDHELRICKGNAGTVFALLRLQQSNPISTYFE